MSRTNLGVNIVRVLLRGYCALCIVRWELLTEATESTEIFYSLPMGIDFCFIVNFGDGLPNHTHQ